MKSKPTLFVDTRDISKREYYHHRKRSFFFIFGLAINELVWSSLLFLPSVLFFKSWLPQIWLGPFLNTLSHMFKRTWDELILCNMAECLSFLFELSLQHGITGDLFSGSLFRLVFMLWMNSFLDKFNCRKIAVNCCSFTGNLTRLFSAILFEFGHFLLFCPQILWEFRRIIYEKIPLEEFSVKVGHVSKCF